MNSEPPAAHDPNEFGPPGVCLRCFTPVGDEPGCCLTCGEIWHTFMYSSPAIASAPQREAQFLAEMEARKCCAKHREIGAEFRCMRCNLLLCPTCAYFRTRGFLRKRKGDGPFCLVCFRLVTVSNEFERRNWASGDGTIHRLSPLFIRDDLRRVLSWAYWILAIASLFFGTHDAFEGEMSWWVWESFRQQLARHGPVDALLDALWYLIFYSSFISIPYAALAMIYRPNSVSEESENSNRRTRIVFLAIWCSFTGLLFGRLTVVLARVIWRSIPSLWWLIAWGIWTGMSFEAWKRLRLQARKQPPD